MEKITPSGDNVLLQIIEQEKTAGGLHIPEKARGNQRDAQLGRVVAIGPGRRTEYGTDMPVEYAVGEYALLGRGAGVEVETANGKMRIIRSCELLAKVEESRILTLVQP